MDSQLRNAAWLLAAAGWSEKRVRQLMLEIETVGSAEVVKVFQSAKRKMAEPRVASSKASLSAESAIDQAMRILRSVGAYSETEVYLKLSQQTAGKGLPVDDLQKGGIKAWLERLTTAIGPERMLDLAKSVRNEMVHNPPPSWSTKDLK